MLGQCLSNFFIIGTHLLNPSWTHLPWNFYATTTLCICLWILTFLWRVRRHYIVYDFFFCLLGGDVTSIGNAYIICQKQVENKADDVAVLRIWQWSRVDHQNGQLHVTMNTAMEITEIWPSLTGKTISQPPHPGLGIFWGAIGNWTAEASVRFWIVSKLKCQYYY